MIALAIWLAPAPAGLAVVCAPASPEWMEDEARVAAFLVLPSALAFAFRNSHTRRRLAALANKAIGRS